ERNPHAAGPGAFVRGKPRFDLLQHHWRVGMNGAVHQCYFVQITPTLTRPNYTRTMIIQPMPNLSVNMPNLGEKKVFISGILTWPPSDKALHARSASASEETTSESEKPSNFP